MILGCQTCTSARVVHIGPRAGSLWCFVKRSPVNPESACQSYPEGYEAMQKRINPEYAKWVGPTPSQRVLVKSAVESQFETKNNEGGTSFQSRRYPESVA